MLSPTQLMQSVFSSKTERLPESIGDGSVRSGAFIDFVEMRQGFAGKQDPSGLRVFYRRTINIVQQAFCEVAGGGEIFQTLLVLNTYCRTAEFVGQAHSGNIHFALLQDLALGQLGRFV